MTMELWSVRSGIARAIRRLERDRGRLGFHREMPHGRRMPKKGRSFVNQSISFPPKLLADAKARAKNLGLSLSAFVQKCMERDLADRPDIVCKESGGAQIAVPQVAPKPRRPRK
jgi:hypothetical protein